MHRLLEALVSSAPALQRELNDANNCRRTETVESSAAANFVVPPVYLANVSRPIRFSLEGRRR